MDFTPKKQPLTAVTASAIRHNPYSSGGSNYMRKFRQNRNGLSPKTLIMTPARPNVHKNLTSRASRILASSKHRTTPTKHSPPVAKQKTISQATKRPFSDVNGLENANNPYNLFTDEEDEGSPQKESKVVAKNKENLYHSSDDEIFVSSNKERKSQSVCEKENSLFSLPKSNPVKVYSNKRKPVSVSRSRLVRDISPDKVDKAYGTKSVLIEEKENHPATFYGESSTAKSLLPQFYDDSSSSKALLPHLIGFPNYGNTCYLNSVLQSLLGLPTFLCDYRQIASELGLNHTSLFYGLSQVLYSRMKGQTSGVKVSLRTIKENLERIDDSFSGFKMQDANEFLTKVLDTIKDEIDRCYANPSENPSHVPLKNYRTSDDLDEDILLNGAIEKNVIKELQFPPKTEVCFSEDFEDSDLINCVAVIESFEKENRSVVKTTVLNNPLENSDINVRRNDRVTSMLQENGLDDFKNETTLRNPVKDNFEFQLLESYRCLGCGEVEGRKQEYFGLYVNLPDDNGQTIQDAIATYMEADERELKCDKCSHDNSSVVTTITRLPRILIIQLKRYEYKPEQHESIKMSSKVLVNRWIYLDQFMTDDAVGPSQWNPERTFSNKKLKPSTLSVRNLSSELNTCDPKEDGEVPTASPSKLPDGNNFPTPDNEDEELQMVMRRSMEEVQGGQEEDEIQQAIRLSLQEMGMSYSQENQEDTETNEEKEQAISVNENKEIGQHSYCLISIISHFGLTTNTGHYVSDVYNCDEDSWFHYDDESVAKISESVVFAEGRQKNGYIFFYMHKDLFQQVKNKNKR